MSSPTGSGAQAGAARLLAPPERPEPANLRAWLRLMATPGIGREGARRLLAAFGSAPAVFSASPAAWRQVVGAAGVALAEAPPDHDQHVDVAERWLDADGRHHVLLLGDPAYPEPLLNTADPPLMLWLAGDPGRLNQPSVAIVGSRRPTPQGREHAARFGEGLAIGGLVVVSGLAAGIDGAAHTGALRPGGGRTVAVVGTGIDRAYPAVHRPLQRRILDEGGLLVSELPLGSGPLAHHFPQRNRIIAGLSLGTLVVEAALRSGSLITARLAVEAGREVMVLPGSIQAEQAAGGHELIRQGATLVTSVEQVEEALGWTPLGAARPMATGAAMAGRDGETAGSSGLPVGRDTVPTVRGGAERSGQPLPVRAGLASEAEGDGGDEVLQALGHEPTALDALIARCGWPAPRLQAHLLSLELAGQVARLPGGLYQRVSVV